jgi:hypothetical protein
LELYARVGSKALMQKIPGHSRMRAEQSRAEERKAEQRIAEQSRAAHRRIQEWKTE